MDNALKTYLLDLVIDRYVNPLEVFLLDPDNIVSVKVKPAVIGGVNTVAKVTMSDGNVQEVSYNRELLSNAITAVFGTSTPVFDITEDITSEVIAEYLTDGGLSISANEINVTKLGTTGLKIECSDESVRYYGSMNVAFESIAK